jgi:hypothetical protein
MIDLLDHFRDYTAPRFNNAASGFAELSAN